MPHQRLIAEKEGIILLFVGEWRTGKTSILFQILNGRLGEGFLPIFVDMAAMAPVAGDREVFARLANLTLEGARDERLVPDCYDFSQVNPVVVLLPGEGAIGVPVPSPGEGGPGSTPGVKQTFQGCVYSLSLRSGDS